MLGLKQNHISIWGGGGVFLLLSCSMKYGDSGISGCAISDWTVHTNAINVCTLLFSFVLFIFCNVISRWLTVCEVIFGYMGTFNHHLITAKRNEAMWISYMMFYKTCLFKMVQLYTWQCTGFRAKVVCSIEFKHRSTQDSPRLKDTKHKYHKKLQMYDWAFGIVQCVFHKNLGLGSTDNKAQCITGRTPLLVWGYYPDILS